MHLCLVTLLAVCCLSATASVSKGAAQAAIGRCYAAAKAPRGTFDTLLKTRKIPQNKEEKCFMGCLYKELGLTKNGGLNVELGKGLTALKFAGHPDKIRKANAILETCNKSVKNINDECLLGFKARECFVMNSDPTLPPFFSETS